MFSSKTFFVFLVALTALIAVVQSEGSKKQVVLETVQTSCNVQQILSEAGIQDANLLEAERVNFGLQTFVRVQLRVSQSVRVPEGAWIERFNTEEGRFYRLETKPGEETEPVKYFRFFFDRC